MGIKIRKTRLVALHDHRTICRIRRSICIKQARYSIPVVFASSHHKPTRFYLDRQRVQRNRGRSYEELRRTHFGSVLDRLAEVTRTDRLCDVLGGGQSRTAVRSRCPKIHRNILYNIMLPSASTANVAFTFVEIYLEVWAIGWPSRTFPVFSIVTDE